MIACSSARVSNIVGRTRVMQAASEQGKSQVTRRRVISYSKRERHLNVKAIFTSRPVCFTLDFKQNPRSNELKKTKFGWLFKEGLNLGSVNCEWRSCWFFWMRMLALFFFVSYQRVKKVACSINDSQPRNSTLNAVTSLANQNARFL